MSATRRSTGKGVVSRGVAPFAPVAVLVAAGLVSVQGGCYKRVTHITGPGGSHMDVQEPYAESSRIDRWIYGGSASKDNTR